MNHLMLTGEQQAALSALGRNARIQMENALTKREQIAMHLLPSLMGDNPSGADNVAVSRALKTADLLIEKARETNKG